MPTLLFISHDGVEQSVEAKIGDNRSCHIKPPNRSFS